MNVVYVVQMHNLGEWQDDMSHDPYDDYWTAVYAAVREAEQYESTQRVVKRVLTPQDEEVFVIEGESK